MVRHSPRFSPSLTPSSPWVILNDFGGAFSMGAVGGGIWYGIKGARNSPRVRLTAFSSLSLLSPALHRANVS
jgi:hypothetical protein